MFPTRRFPGPALALCALVALATPAAGATAAEIVQRMIAAHGGMERWAAAPTVSFEEEWGGEEGGVGRVTVDQRSRRAYIDFPGTEMSLVWDGRRAWSQNWAAPTPPRFLALLNYYFTNLPWLTRDPGVILGDPGSGKLFDDPTEYVTIKMTFAPGTGDTPDDYYVLYIHPETHELAANEYIVTYRALLPEGVESTDPHILIYDSWTEADGLKVPTHYTIYELDQKVYATCAFRDWSFTRPFDETRMTMPDGAVLDESRP